MEFQVGQDVLVSWGEPSSEKPFHRTSDTIAQIKNGKIKLERNAFNRRYDLNGEYIDHHGYWEKIEPLTPENMHFVTENIPTSLGLRIGVQVVIINSKGQYKLWEVRYICENQHFVLAPKDSNLFDGGVSFHVDGEGNNMMARKSVYTFHAVINNENRAEMKALIY